MSHGGNVVAWRFDGLITDITTGEQVAATVTFRLADDGTAEIVIDCRGVVNRRVFPGSGMDELTRFARACYFPAPPGDDGTTIPATITDMDGKPALTVVQETRRRVRLRRSGLRIADLAAAVAPVWLSLGCALA